MTLRNQAVLITGAASGIGAETARQLHRRGACLVLTDVDASGLADLAAELGSEVETLAGDVSDLQSVERVVAAAVTRFGRLDLVLANSGIASYGSILNVDPQTFRRIVEVNLIGVFNTVRAALPALIESRGYMLAVSSLSALAPMQGSAGYNATNAGVEQFVNTLRIEGQHLGVKVGSAHPDWIGTPLVRDLSAGMCGFDTYRSKLPRSCGSTISVRTCASAIVGGLNHRRRRLYTPKWVRYAGSFDAIAAGVGEDRARPHVGPHMDQIDLEVVVLGRSASSRTSTEPT